MIGFWRNDRIGALLPLPGALKRALKAVATAIDGFKINAIITFRKYP